MIQADAITELMKAGRDAATIGIHKMPQDPDVHLIHNHSTGTLERVVCPRFRSHLLTRIDDLASLVARLASAAGGESVSVWVSLEGICAVFDDDRGRNTATFKTNISKEWKTLRALCADRPGWNQRELINMLRLDFSGCVDADVLAKFRKLKCVYNEDKESDVQDTGETFGKTINAKASGVDDLPQSFEISAAICDDEELGDAATITTLVSVSFQEWLFHLVPLRHEMLAAEQAMMQQMKKLFDEALTAAIARLPVEQHDVMDRICIYSGSY